MPGTLMCSAGHQWTPASQDAASPHQANRTCPVCGAPAVVTPNPSEAPTLAPTPDAEAPVDSRETVLPVAAAEGNGVPRSPNPADWPEVEGYDIVEVLGRGAMGVVYKARHRQLKRLVALKMILAGSHAGAAELKRFRVEAEALARLQHPHIVQIHEVGEQNGLPFFSLELVEGGSLAQQLDGTPWQAKRAAALVEALAQAVEAAHRRGIIHRDLKPGNVLLTADGTPKITDFGLARLVDAPSGLTATGVVLGTPSYMAPEQAGGKGKEAGPAADIYALGAVLYELLTGRPPFRAATPLDTIRQVMAEEPVPPSALQPPVPRDLETVCLKCLRKEPHERYASAAALAGDLRLFLTGKPVQARPLSAWEKMIHAGKRRLRMAKLLAAGPDGSPAEGPAPSPVPVEVGTSRVDSFPLPVLPDFDDRMTFGTRFLPSSFGRKVLAHRSARLLVLRPSWIPRLWFGGPWLLFAVFSLAMWLLVGHASPRRAGPEAPFAVSVFVGVMGLVCVAIGALFLLRGRHIRFDLDRGQITDRWFWSRKALPLRDVIAVQVLVCYPHEPWYLRLLPFPGSASLWQTVVRAFQINLALNDPYQPRLNLAIPWDGQWARQTSRDIAAFLGVPLIDLVVSAEPSRQPG